ncbi:hypothetical protein [Natronorubrum tibetense]|uniref:UDP-glucose 6-dehydrogenase n=1 Tax=Natronorubrum tibetense GA33 TaxID=1114856 RepID=L9VKK8_9EURY|nr:hypothetical protein [Natronorubrum tibetense]ELY37674.1 UDP-glucose 6-dehydrogenase [Natronorubrum tibetense GA33]
MNPEFLREGSAVTDFLHPNKLVIGTNSKWTTDRLRALDVTDWDEFSELHDEFD